MAMSMHLTTFKNPFENKKDKNQNIILTFALNNRIIGSMAQQDQK